MPAESEDQFFEDQDLVRFCVRIRKERLHEVLVRLGVSVDEEKWRAFNTRNGGKLVEIIYAQRADVREKAQRAFNDISKVGGQNKQIPVIIAALKEWDVELPEGFADSGAPEMSAWCYLNLSGEQWSKLSTRAITKNYRLGEWKVYDLAFDNPPSEGRFKAAEAELQKEMSDIMMKFEQRGHHCKSDCYTVDRDETIIFKLTDYPDANEVWKDSEDDFVSSEDKAAFRIVVTFNYASRRLGVHYPQAKKERVALIANALAGKAFGNNFRHAEQVVYDLSKLLANTRLRSEPALGIESARVVGFDLELDNSKKRRRSYYEEERDLATAIRQELGEDGVLSEEIRVVRAHIRLEFGLVGNRRSRRTFVVSQNGVNGWKSVSSELRDTFSAYAKKIGIVLDGTNTDAS